MWIYDKKKSMYPTINVFLNNSRYLQFDANSFFLTDFHKKLQIFVFIFI